MTALNSWNDVANGGPGAAITILTDPAVIATVDFSAFGVLYIPSSFLHTAGGISTAQLDALNARQVDVVSFVNVLGGGLIALTEANIPNAYGWLPIAIETADQLHTNVCPTLALTAALAPAATCANMSHGFYHNVFTGPPGFLGMDVLATSADAPLDQAVLLGGANVVIGGQITLTPATATNPVDTQHTVAASVQDGLPPFAPIPGAQVTFDVISGPNVGDTGTAITDVAGMAGFSYPGDGGAGLDQIQAQFTDANGTHFSNTVTKTWIGGQINLAPNTITIGLGNPHTLTATALQGTTPFGPLAGVLVTFDVISGPDIGDSGTGITDVSGVATFVYTGHNGEGVDQIQASFADSAGTHLSNIVTANWLQGSKDCNGNSIPDECETASAFADLDMDGDVDPSDFLTFSNCFNGALNAPKPSCGNLCADLDKDGDVDPSDFLTFSNCFNGALNPPSCP